MKLKVIDIAREEKKGGKETPKVLLVGWEGDTYFF